MMTYLSATLDIFTLRFSNFCFRLSIWGKKNGRGREKIILWLNCQIQNSSKKYIKHENKMTKADNI